MRYKTYTFWSMGSAIARVLRCFQPYLRDERSVLRGLFVSLLAGTGLRVLEPWPLKLVFDHLVTVIARDRGDALPSFDALESINVFVSAALGLLGVLSLRVLVMHWHEVRCTVLAQRFLTALRGVLCQCLPCWPLTTRSTMNQRELLRCFVEDGATLQEALVTTLRPLLANVLLLYGMFAAMSWLCWELTLLPLTAVLLFGLMIGRVAPFLSTLSRLQWKREERLAAVTAEAIELRKPIQTLSLEEQYARLLSGHGGRSVSARLKAQQLAARLERRGSILTAVTTTLVLPYGAWAVLQGKLTPGELLVFGVYAWSVCQALREVAASIRELASTVAASERLTVLLECVPLLLDESRAERAPTFRGAVRFENVSFKSASDQRVLEDIDFAVRPGQRVAIVSPPGSGASALVDLLLRFSDPLQGQISIDGRDVRSFTVTSLRSQISVVSQDDQLFTASVRDNIACGAPRATPGEVKAAAQAANAHAFILALPCGYDTVVGEGGFPLSAVQRRLLSCARVAARGAPILLLDQPTANLDEEDKRTVQEALERLALGRATVLVTHDFRFAVRADLILTLENGRVRECGAHRDDPSESSLAKDGQRLVEVRR
jgi:ATP-binding cassette subfamily B protein